MKKIMTVFLFLMLLLPAGSTEKRWRVYFTNPSKNKKVTVVNPLDGLVSAIRKSEKSFYGAFYDISSLKIADELIEAFRRGVDVKLVTEKDTFSGEAINRILQSGIPIIPDTGNGLMHNKFAVIDNNLIFTGSYNTTDNCTYKNNNNAIAVYSPELAEIYNAEFSEMFDLEIFGNRHEPGAFASLKKKYYADVDGIDINVYFAPEDNVERILRNRLEKAERSIRFMQFSFTSDIIGETIIRKHKEGITVEGVFERKGSNTEYSEYVKMKIEDIPVRLDGNRFYMHHKVIIIDDYRVITGSFNISNNANKRNDENIIIIDSREIALEYLEEFRRIYSGAK